MVDLQTFEFQTIRVDERGRIIERQRKQAQGFVEDLCGGVKLEMVKVPGGEFWMGSSNNEVQAALADDKRRFEGSDPQWHTRETPRHRVTVPTFFMGKYQVTQAQWREVAKLPKVQIDLLPEPSHLRVPNAPEVYSTYPVEQVSWNEAREFCTRLMQRTGRPYRLPSEAEWEYACRAGTATPFAFGPTITQEIVHYNRGYPHIIKSVYSLGVANAFGLFDLHGNVWEWCEDGYHDNYDGAPDDGRAWGSGESSKVVVMRGGSWCSLGDLCRSAFRDYAPPDVRSEQVGLRVVVSAKAP